MTIQTLVVTTNQTDYSLIEKMNIQTDALIGNQCGENNHEVIDYGKCEIQFVSFNSKGVGINRNELLLRATADICVLADDDMVFNNNYADTVHEWFKKIPDADVLIFNLNEKTPRRHKNTCINKINSLNYAKYGAARIAFRTKSIHLNGIFFNTMFGGGCEYSCGEDTLFLKDCLKKGLNIFGVPAAIASIEDGNSTWFNGYTDKFFFDKGVLYYFLNKKLCCVHALYHCLKHRKKYNEYGWKNAFCKMQEGIKSVRR